MAQSAMLEAPVRRIRLFRVSRLRILNRVAENQKVNQPKKGGISHFSSILR